MIGGRVQYYNFNAYAEKVWGKSLVTLKYEGIHEDNPKAFGEVV